MTTIILGQRVQVGQARRSLKKKMSDLKDYGRAEGTVEVIESQLVDRRVDLDTFRTEREIVGACVLLDGPRPVHVWADLCELFDPFDGNDAA